MNNGDKTYTDGIQVESKFLKWFENYWYHYKWITIGVAILVAVILVCSIQAATKKREDIALGNIIGSGIYNIVLIIGACSVVSPLTGNGKDSIDSMIIMNGTAFLLWIFLLTARKLKLYRWQGIIFLALYAAFIVWSILCVK